MGGDTFFSPPAGCSSGPAINFVAATAAAKKKEVAKRERDGGYCWSKKKVCREGEGNIVSFPPHPLSFFARFFYLIRGADLLFFKWTHSSSFHPRAGESSSGKRGGRACTQNGMPPRYDSCCTQDGARRLRIVRTHAYTDG